MRHENPICGSNMHKIKPYSEGCKTIFEIGAYDGVDVEEIKNNFGNDCAIHAFEPDPESFSKLEYYYKSEGVICNNIALSNHVGTTKFVKCWDPKLEDQSKRDIWYKTAQSIRHNTKDHILSKKIVEEEIDVPVTTIKEYCSINSVIPDILLIDTQGSEWEILDGAGDILNNVKVLMTEWSTKELYVGQKMLPAIVELLGKYNFKLVEKINLWEDFHGDAIFAK
jgi:FkbM family methyltransferase